MTKTKKRRIAKRITTQRLLDAGKTIPPKKYPPYYIPKETPILHAISLEEQIQKSLEYEQTSAVQLKRRMEHIQNTPSTRFHFDQNETTAALVQNASPRVQKLLQLTIGSQKEVVQAQKKKGMALFQVREGDTGSSAVQVIALTTRIQQLQRHVSFHKKDYSTKRGLEALYVRRRKVLDYMERKDFDSYRKVVKTLGLIR